MGKTLNVTCKTSPHNPQQDLEEENRGENMAVYQLSVTVCDCGKVAIFTDCFPNQIFPLSSTVEFKKKMLNKTLLACTHNVTHPDS